MAVFGQGTAAETDHRDTFRCRMEQQKPHHGACVVENQPVWVGFEHAALDGWKAEMQGQGAIFIMQQGQVCGRGVRCGFEHGALSQPESASG